MSTLDCFPNDDEIGDHPQECFICGDKFACKTEDCGLALPPASDKLIRFLSFRQQSDLDSTHSTATGTLTVLSKSVEYYRQLFARPDVNFCRQCMSKINEIMTIIQQLKLMGEQINGMQEELAEKLVNSVRRRTNALNEPRKNVLRELECRLSESRPTSVQIKLEPEEAELLAEPINIKRLRHNYKYKDPSLAYVKLTRYKDHNIRSNSESDCDDNNWPGVSYDDDGEFCHQNEYTEEPMISMSKPRRRGGPANAKCRKQGGQNNQEKQKSIAKMKKNTAESCQQNVSPRTRKKRIKKKTDEGNAEFQCKFCAILFSYKGLWNHVKLDHEGQLLQRESTSAAAEEHAELDLTSGTLTLKCNFCSFISHSYRGIWKHIRTSHSREAINNYDDVFRPNAKVPSLCRWTPTQHICDHCGKVMKSVTALKAHVRKHETPDEISSERAPCDQCPKVLSSISALRYHKRVCHDKKFNLACNLCDFRCMFNNQLQGHVRTSHTHEKTKVCDICGKGFFKQYKLNVHMRSHTGEKPYVCKYCGKGFARQSNHVRHEATHGTARPHPCELCGVRFPTRHNLVGHVRSHHMAKGIGAGIKPTRKSKYNCDPDPDPVPMSAGCEARPP